MSGSSSESHHIPTGRAGGSSLPHDSGQAPTSNAVSALEVAESLWLAITLARDIGPSEPTQLTETDSPPHQSPHPALTNALELAAALSELAIDNDSPGHPLENEDAIVHAAETGTWPYRQPPSPRRFEVAYIVDTSPSMEIWRPVVLEFRDLLGRSGAFRDIRTYLLNGSTSTLETPGLRAEGGATQGWDELLDPTNRRLIVVVTDAVGAAWRSRVANALLARWAWSMPVVIVHTMPPRLWRWGALAPRRMRLYASRHGVANRQLRIAPAEPSWGPAPIMNRYGVAIPVLALDAAWLHNWARLFSGTGHVTMTVVFASPDGGTDTEVPTEPGLPLTAAERVRRFRAFASIDAFRLARLLSPAPLSLDTIDLVQRELLPKAGLDVQAEVLLGGLLRRLPPGSVPFDFHDGVRDELLLGMVRSDVAEVARLVSGRLGARVPALRAFGRALDDPHGTELPDVYKTDRQLIELQATVFTALSGPYSQRGIALAQLLATSTVPSPAGENLTSSGRGRPPFNPDVISQPRIWGDVMPLRNPDFVGRDELLTQLRQRLARPGTTAVLPEALHGAGGVGKSQTVVEYIYRYASEYDLIWWIAAEHPTQIRNSFMELARRLDIPAVSGADAARSVVLEALNRGEPYSRWILVFDNAEDPNAIIEFLPSETGHVVITSRNAQWASVARAVEVDLFTRVESAELLRRRGGDISDIDADRLASALGDLPLAIEQAANWLAQTSMPVSEYLTLLEQYRTELLQLPTTTPNQASVAAAWSVPLSQLRAEHPEALALLEICAFFGPEPISRRLFSGVPGASVPDVLRSALNNPIKLNSAIREINRYGLAKIDHRNNTLQLHRLVQAVLRNQVPEDQHEAMRHVAHTLLVNGDPSDPNNAKNWPQYAELLPHALTSEAVRCRDEWVRALLINLVRYLTILDDHQTGSDLSRQAWETWKAEIGERDLQTLTMARHHGFILRRQQEFRKAQALNRRTYDLMVNEYGEDNEVLLIVADAVALDLRGEGKFVPELKMRQDTYNRARQLLGDDDPQTLVYGFNLASCLRQVGSYFAARELDEEIYRRRMITHGADHQQTFRSIDAIAMDLRECGEYIEACQMEEDAIQRQRNILGKDYIRTIGALRNLAVARRKAGDLDGALELSTECYMQYQQRQGELHVDTITSMMNMSVDCRHLGELPRSRELGRRSREQYVKVYGANHPYVHIAATNLSPTLRLLGDADGARRLNEDAVAFYRSEFGLDHPSGLMMATNLASDLAVLGDTIAAYALDQDTLARSRRVLGESHPLTPAIMTNLSLDLVDLGRFDEASALHAKALEIFRQKLGTNHPSTVAAERKIRANCDTDTMQL